MNGEMRLEDGRIDLISLAETMWKQGRRFWWLLLLLAGIGAAACSFLVKKTYQPVYTAFAAYAVSSDSVYAGNKNYEQKVAEQIGVVFPYILTSDVLREKVCEKMGTKTMPGSIDASVVQDTNLITIRARAANAGRAYELLQAVLACYPEILHPVTGVLKMELLDESGVPHQPDNIPDGRRVALEGAAGGSLLFILIVLFGAMAKKTVRNREDLQRLTQIHYLGSLPKTRAKKRSAAFLDARYAICARLEKELKKKNMHTLLVTSAVAGEGKTTVACNLALGLEKKGYSVLLLDADLRKPAVCRTIQLDSGTEGAYEVLTGQKTKCSFSRKSLPLCGCWMENIWSRCIRDASWTVKTKKRKVSAMKYGIKTIRVKTALPCRHCISGHRRPSLNLSRMSFIRSLPDT